MQKLGKELPSLDYWKKEAEEYSSVLDNDYHTHRLGVIRKLIPADVVKKGKRVLDFGCGNGVLFPQFIDAGAEIRGIDMTPEMIAAAGEFLKKKGLDPKSVREGTVTALKEEKSASYDALMCFNVLPYLTAQEETMFYQEAARIIKPGGYLIVTHNNELFDMFTFNKFTIEFMKKYMVKDPLHASQISTLLTKPTQPDKVLDYNIRENPFSFKHKLQKYHFREVRQEFIHRHLAPPLLLKEETFPDTLNFKEEDRWTLTFTCSIFGSCSVRE